jgi:membrane-associated protein
MNRMAWPTFLFWNALGGIAWATSVTLSVYFLGALAERFLGVAGVVAAGLAIAAIGVYLLYRRRRADDSRTTNTGADGE